MTLLLRGDKGSALTHSELDGNFVHFRDATIWQHGWQYFQNTLAAQNLSSGTPTPLLNNGNSVDDHRIPGKGNLWNTSTNELDFTDCAVGGSIIIRADLQITTNSNDDEFDVVFEGGVGAITPGVPLFSFPIDSRHFFKDDGTYDLVAYTEVFLGSTLITDFPSRISVVADGAGDEVLVRGFYIRYLPQHPVIVYPT